MAVETWGTLPKAQDDPTTIDDAVSSAIAAHLADPAAHLDTGASLANHRENTIVDHPQGSVLGDKFSNQDFVFTPTFESLDSWSSAGATVQAQPGGFKLGTAATTNAFAYLTAGADYSPVSYQPAKETTFQVSLALSDITSIHAYALAGCNELVNDTPGIGFKFDNGDVYACEAYHASGSYHENTLHVGTFAANAYHLYRVQIVASENKAYFFIDGVEVGTLDLHTDDAGGLALMTFYIKNSSGVLRYIFAGAPYLSIAAT